MSLRNACLSFAAVAAVFLMSGPSLAEDQPMVVKYGDIAEPDAELAAFIADLKADIAKGAAGVPAVEGKFAPKVQAFSRSLDPLEPWRKIKPITKDHLKEVADLIVEQGEMVDANGNSVAESTDYRPQAVEMIGMMMNGKKPLGTLKDMPGAVCSPAAYKFDLAAAQAHAKAHDTSGASLIFYPFEVKFRKQAKKGAEVSAVIPAGTLMASEFEKDLPKDWDHYYAINGADGYMKNRDDHLWLSQMHVCFSKVKGAYKITGIFGYGL